MRIAQVAPLFESVPPRGYGGTERVVSYLTEELVAQGHDVTLFASGDSNTAARLVPLCPRSLRLDPHCIDQLAHQIVLLEKVFQQANDFDIVHFHIDYLHFPLTRRHGIPSLTTLHGRLDIPDLVPLYHEFPELPVVSISNAQRAPLPWINWQGTVYHGLPRTLYGYREQPGQYLAFIGRVSPEKGLDRAIDIARQSGIPLKIAAKIDKADRDYYEAEIKHLIDGTHIELIGEIGDSDKGDFLGAAVASMFLIDWPEPFGMAMIESIACGTPVIAYNHGSVPEVIDEGSSGFIVDSQEAALQALGRCMELSRRSVRAQFEQRFTATHMAHGYLELYGRIIIQNGYPLFKTPKLPKTQTQVRSQRNGLWPSYKLP